MLLNTSKGRKGPHPRYSLSVLGCQWGMGYRKRLEKGLWGIRGERHRPQVEGRVIGTGPGKAMAE